MHIIFVAIVVIIICVPVVTINRVIRIVVFSFSRRLRKLVAEKPGKGKGGRGNVSKTLPKKSKTHTKKKEMERGKLGPL